VSIENQVIIFFCDKLGGDCRLDIDLDEKENYTDLRDSEPNSITPIGMKNISGRSLFF
jgi:hypothetical protein